METPDTTVRVLYDFNYTTKDGRNIKIKCGERLFLIKKTNNDWWQVIRSFERRPFYVPASYVEEIQRNKTVCAKIDESHQRCEYSLTNNEADSIVQHKSLQHLERTDGLSIDSDKMYRNRSFSLEDKRISSYPNKDKYNSISKTHFRTLSSSGYESLSEIGFPGGDQNPISPHSDTDYVNLSEDGDTLILENIQTVPNKHKTAVNSGEAVSTDKETLLSALDKDVQDTIFSQLNKIEIDNSKSGNYSNVSCAYNTVQELDSKSKSCLDSKIPLSSSLEELAQEIELKTNKLRACVDSTKLFHSSELLGSFKEESVVQRGMFESDKLSHNIEISKNEESSINSDNIPKKLQYSGSFKTKLERQKWAKQFFGHSNLKNVIEGEQMMSLCKMNKNEDCSTTNVTSIDINYVKLCDTGSVQDLSLKEEERMQKEAAHPLQASDRFSKENMNVKHKSGSHHSLDSIFEDKESNHCTSNSDVNLGSEKQIEALVSTNVDSLKKVNLSKSSIDSLLELETDSNREKISEGTTSDGDDLCLNNSDSETDSVILGISRLKNNGANVNKNQKRRISLSRNRRVDSCKSRQYPLHAPPSPTSSQIPTRTLMDGWNEFITDDGRKFFFNSLTQEKSWKPPRKKCNSNEEIHDKTDSARSLYSKSLSPIDDIFPNLPLPTGWQTDIDPETGLPCYINITNGAKWFSSSDHEGRVYFFEENSNESSWTLPETTVYNINKKLEEKPKVNASQQPDLPLAVSNWNRSVKSRSMVFTDRCEDAALLHPGSPNWPQLWDGNMCVLKEGPLNRTKITENGKRLRKNWGTTHVVLTELFLLFFKDNKGFEAMKSGGARPELCVDLNGALIDRGDKVSSRKNVYILSTVLGLQVLIQSDDHNIAEKWLAAINSAIKHLPMPVGLDNSNRGLKGNRELSALEPNILEEPKKGSRIGRSKSVKLKHKDESIEDLSVSHADRQIKIRERLKKFFHRRPTMESLVKKGIWKDEPVFGCYLEQVCGAEFPRVPLFVQRCIQCIEHSEENMKTDGLYRASGNLSQVQKIRLQVDQNNYAILEQEEDVHVLTGALKLFFRELKQPLLPFHFFNKALKASTNHNRKEKLKDFREIVKALPIPNHDTLKFLLQHLIRVTKYQEFNRMHIPNLAIVFGPTLMWSEQESLNMAFDLMQQNLVIECFLAEFDQIFR